MAAIPAVAYGESSGEALNGETLTREALQQLMWREAGVLRTGAGLAAASAALAGAGRPTAAAGASPAERMRTQEDANLLDLARLTVQAALGREESRGAHHRADFPLARAELARSQSWTRGSTESTPVDTLSWAPLRRDQGAAPAAAPPLVLSATPSHQAEEALAC